LTTEVLVQLVLSFGVVPSLLVYLVYTDRQSRKEEREERKLEMGRAQDRELRMIKESQDREDKMLKESQDRENKILEEARIEREKAQERERKFMDHISKADENMKNFSVSIKQMGDTMNTIDKSMSYLQRDVEALRAKKESLL